MKVTNPSRKTRKNVLNKGRRWEDMSKISTLGAGQPVEASNDFFLGGPADPVLFCRTLIFPLVSSLSLPLSFSLPLLLL